MWQVTGPRVAYKYSLFHSFINTEYYHNIIVSMMGKNSTGGKAPVYELHRS